MVDFKFEPMRSFIYVNVAKEDYRPLLQRWLYKTHVPDSISQFEPYVTKYAFYPSYPCPPDGDRFGYAKMQLTEHHWLVSDLDPRLGIKAIAETFPPEVLLWQGNITPEILEMMKNGPGPEAAPEEDGDIGNEARSTNVEGANPFIFCFCPMWWEDDIKGAGRNIEDGANYRWNFAIGYPEGVSTEEGDKWLFEEVIPIFEKAPECTRILHSKVKKEINGGTGMEHVFEMFFENQSAWHKVAVEDTKAIAKPAWAQQDEFPFLKPYHKIIGCCVSDFTMSNNLANYRGYMPRR